MASTSASVLPLEVQEADDDVRHLHAGVVDVVLDADGAAAVPQHAHEGVAQGRVAEVADVRGLVGVDAGVLDDHARPGSRPSAAPPGREQLASERAAVQEEVDVAAAGHLRPHDAGHCAQLGRQRLRDLPRLAAQRLGQVERRGQREVAHLGPGRVLERDAGRLGAEGVRRATSRRDAARRSWRSRIMVVGPKVPIIPAREPLRQQRRGHLLRSRHVDRDPRLHGAPGRPRPPALRGDRLVLAPPPGGRAPSLVSFKARRSRRWSSTSSRRRA